MKLEITGPSTFVILAETEHEQQWLKAITEGFAAKELDVVYTYPNYEPKGLNNPAVQIGPHE